MHTAKNAGAYVTQVVGDGHCVKYVQEAAGAPHTSQWKRGERVKGSKIPPGTAIATFSADGKYENKTDGSSHAAIYVSQDQHGIWVLDQWQGRPVNRRLIRFKDNDGKKVNDGDQFYVVET